MYWNQTDYVPLISGINSETSLIISLRVVLNEILYLAYVTLSALLYICHKYLVLDMLFNPCILLSVFFFFPVESSRTIIFMYLMRWWHEDFPVTHDLAFYIKDRRFCLSDVWRKYCSWMMDFRKRRNAFWKIPSLNLRIAFDCWVNL